MQCWDKGRVPARLKYGHNPRVPQLLCLVVVGWRITTRSAIERDDKRGIHHAASTVTTTPRPLCRRCSRRTGRRSARATPWCSFRNVDVYPLMAQLLGLRPQTSDDNLSVLHEALAQPVH